MPIDNPSSRTRRKGTSPPAQAEAQALGLRERHKLDKLARIADASILLFGRDGYDATTLREIAREADVALGTLGLYARDKRDLVLLIFNKVVPPLIEQGHGRFDPDATLTDNMVGFFEPFYRAYADDITLYRVVLGQVFNGLSSAHAEENDAIRRDLLNYLEDMVRHAIATGEAREDVDVPLQARSFFYLYFAAVRIWLFQERPDPDRGLATLHALYDQHVAGIKPG